MAKFIWDPDKLKFVDPEEFYAKRRERLEQSRSDLPMPAIRPDGMDALQNHADGLWYDSRSSYEKAVKSAGCEIIGDEKLPDNSGPKPYEPQGVSEDIKAAYDEVVGT